MQIDKITTRIKARTNALLKFRPKWRQVGIFGGVILGSLIVVNLALAWYFQDRFYPNIKAGDIEVGGMTYSRARQVLVDIVDRRPVSLQFGAKTVKVPTTKLGVEYDIDATLALLKQQPRPLMPMLWWLDGQSVKATDLIYDLDEAVFNHEVSELAANHNSEPHNAELEIKDGNAKIKPHTNGFIFDPHSVALQVKSALNLLSSAPFFIDGKVKRVEINSDSLKSALKNSDNMLGVSIRLRFEDKEFSPTRTEIGSWLEVNQELEVEVSEALVLEYVVNIADDLDIPVKNEVITTVDGVETERQDGEAGRSLNRDETVKAIINALKEHKNLAHVLTVEAVEPVVEYNRKFSRGAITYNYCVQANAVDSGLLDQFSGKIASTLADSRGWGVGGRISYNRVDAGCAFNLVLAAAHTLPSYSSVCSIYYSCRVGSNVIINLDRWQGATDSWNNAGGSLADYQSMVINHELGHWLGFSDNQWVCPGPGQLAPLMQQQSINLRGCQFNPWPTPYELDALRTYKGI